MARNGGVNTGAGEVLGQDGLFYFDKCGTLFLSEKDAKEQEVLFDHVTILPAVVKG